MRYLIHIAVLMISIMIASVTPAVQSAIVPVQVIVAPATATPAGNDSNPCSVTAPCLTWAHAQTVARTVLASGGCPLVSFRAGLYTLPASLAYASADNGSPSCTVAWQSYPGESAIISGGSQITGWSLCTAADGVCNASGVSVYKASVPAGSKFRELFVCPDGTGCAFRPRAYGKSATGTW